MIALIYKKYEVYKNLIIKGIKPEEVAIVFRQQQAMKIKQKRIIYEWGETACNQKIQDRTT